MIQLFIVICAEGT